MQAARVALSTWLDQRGTGNRGSGRLSEEYTVDQESEDEIENTSPVHAETPSSLHDSFNDLTGVHLDFPARPSWLTLSYIRIIHLRRWSAMICNWPAMSATGLAYGVLAYHSSNQDLSD